MGRKYLVVKRPTFNSYTFLFYYIVLYFAFLIVPGTGYF
jgi:hypothetical protein